MKDMIARIIDAWNKQDADEVAECYTPDAVYSDPFTRGKIKGRNAFRLYLTKVFAAWEMR